MGRLPPALAHVTDHVRTEQAAAHHRLAGRSVEIGAGTSPVPGVTVTVDHRTDEPGVGCEEGRWAVPDVCADMGALPFRAGAFDTLVAIHVLEHDPDTLAILYEWARVARRLVIVCPDQEHYPGNTVGLDPTHRAAFCPDQLACLVAHVGLSPTVEPAIPRWSFLVEAG